MRWEHEVPLSGHTRYRVGGPAERFARVRTRRELRMALARRPEAGHRTLGGGANLLVADRGVEGAVIVLDGEFDFVRLEEASLEAGAGASLPALVGAARRDGRAGFGFLEAVPGTVGGGLRMNAGSSEVWMWERVIWAEAMTPSGEVVRLTPEEAAPAYRRTGVDESWVFVGGRLAAPAGDPGRVDREHRRLRTEKVEAQVYDLRSVGSIWKNPGPPHGSAWEVVDAVGMRGARRGGARISDKHANFIVNDGGARAEDVLALMAETRRRAHEEFGLWLEPEIRLWGFGSDEASAVGATPGC